MGAAIERTLHMWKHELDRELRHAATTAANVSSRIYDEYAGVRGPRPRALSMCGPCKGPRGGFGPGLGSWVRSCPGQVRSPTPRCMPETRAAAFVAEKQPTR